MEHIGVMCGGLSMFKRMDLEDAKMRVERSTPATSATFATEDNKSSKSSESSDMTPSKLHFLQENENQDLFIYLHDSVTTSGPYARLWPQVSNYCKRELPISMWRQLEQAYLLQRKSMKMEVAQ